MSYDIEPIYNASNHPETSTFTLYERSFVPLRPIITSDDPLSFIEALAEFHAYCIDEGMSFWHEFHVKIKRLDGGFTSTNTFIRTLNILAHQYERGDVLGIIDETWSYPRIQHMLLESDYDTDVWAYLYRFINGISVDIDVLPFYALEQLYGKLQPSTSVEVFDYTSAEGLTLKWAGIERYQVSAVVETPECLWASLFHSDLTTNNFTPYISLRSPSPY